MAAERQRVLTCGAHEQVGRNESVAEEELVGLEIIVARDAQTAQLEAARLQQDNLVVLFHEHEAGHHFGKLDDLLDDVRQPVGTLQPQFLVGERAEIIVALVLRLFPCSQGEFRLAASQRLLASQSQEFALLLLDELADALARHQTGAHVRLGQR